jgi:nucleotidyltransferase/DNA polymerase involved in DNA repair
LALGVGIKLKTTNFEILTRQRRLSEPTDMTARLYSVGIDLLNQFDQPGPFRLVGMVAFDLVGIEDRVHARSFQHFCSAATLGCGN